MFLCIELNVCQPHQVCRHTYVYLISFELSANICYLAKLYASNVSQTIHWLKCGTAIELHFGNLSREIISNKICVVEGRNDFGTSRNAGMA